MFFLARVIRIVATHLSMKHWAELHANLDSSPAWWIAFGPHGPRAENPPGEWRKIWFYTGIGLVVSWFVFLFIHSFAKPPPRTMTKEWQEATNEYLKVSLPASDAGWGNPNTTVTY